MAGEGREPKTWLVIFWWVLWMAFAVIAFVVVGILIYVGCADNGSMECYEPSETGSTLQFWLTVIGMPLLLVGALVARSRAVRVGFMYSFAIYAALVIGVSWALNALLNR